MEKINKNNCKYNYYDFSYVFSTCVTFSEIWRHFNYFGFKMR